MTENVSSRFERVPTTASERRVHQRPSRQEILSWWTDRYGIPESVFDGYTFWEKGVGKLWIFHGDIRSPLKIETLGLLALRTRQEHWKPTTNVIQRFGSHATRNVIELDTAEASIFIRGDQQALPWDGDWGYLIAARRIAGSIAPLGVGLYIDGELRSQVPKARRVTLVD